MHYHANGLNRIPSSHGTGKLFNINLFEVSPGCSGRAIRPKKQHRRTAHEKMARRRFPCQETLLRAILSGCGINRYKKSPPCLDRRMKGCTQLAWPFVLPAAPIPRQIGGMFKGRSSGSPAFAAAFPPPSGGSGLVLLQRFPLQEGGMTAAGPLPILTGFPIKPYRHL